ncbi:MAG TPA: diacylglycerol kinase family protein [Ktedonobacteraceae bacterium]|nr:diacylglycerol kinase family protein [Ktedonobacteraceae bacterium]
MSTPPSIERKRGLAKFIAGFGFAFSGLWFALRTQVNMQVHIALGILAVVLGIVLRISPVEFAIISLTIGIVLILEMLNTVIELCVDLASPEYHPLAKRAKDAAAGAVLLSAILSIVVALFIFGPHLWALFIHRS